MTEPLKRFKPNTKMVPVPSRSIIPERDVNHSPVLEASHLGIEFGGLKAVAVSDSLNGIIFIIGAVILIPVLAFIALGDGSIAEGICLFATSSPEHLNAIQPANAQPPYLSLIHI